MKTKLISSIVLALFLVVLTFGFNSNINNTCCISGNADTGWAGCQVTISGSSCTYYTTTGTSGYFQVCGITCDTQYTIFIECHNDCTGTRTNVTCPSSNNLVHIYCP